MNDLKLGEIIECLGRIANILHDKPEQALKELQELSSVIDRPRCRTEMVIRKGFVSIH